MKILERRISTGSASCQQAQAHTSQTVWAVEWSCWSEDTPRDLLNDGSARDYGFDGACNFRDWYRALKPNDLPECDHVRTDCSPGASWFAWCLLFGGVRGVAGIQRPDQVETWSSSRRWWKLFAAGDCKATAIRESVDGKMYDGACFFEEKSLDVYWWDAVEASKEYSRTVQPSGRRTRRRAHHPREPEAMIATKTRTLSTFLESRMSRASAG